MPLDKSDAPANSSKSAADVKADIKASDEEAHPATSGDIAELFDSGAGAPAGLREAAEALPERDPVGKHIKAAMLAEDAQTEAKEKAEVVKLSADSPETPSGAALLKAAGIADDAKRADKYARVKAAVRAGLDPEDIK
jgi:hypothetical protein